MHTSTILSSARHSLPVVSLVLCEKEVAAEARRKEQSGVHWAFRRLSRVTGKINLKHYTIVSPSLMSCAAWVQSEVGETTQWAKIREVEYEESSAAGHREAPWCSQAGERAEGGRRRRGAHLAGEGAATRRQRSALA